MYRVFEALDELVQTLEQAYGVRARVERCSQGHLMVLVDEALPSHQAL